MANELRKKGLGASNQQTFLDTYAEVVFAKLYTLKTPLTAAELRNDQVLPFFEEHALGLFECLPIVGPNITVAHDSYAYKLSLAFNDIDHIKTKAKHPQINGIYERFHITVLQEFYQVAFRKKIYFNLEQLKKDLHE